MTTPSLTEGWLIFKPGAEAGAFRTLSHLTQTLDINSLQEWMPQ